MKENWRAWQSSLVVRTVSAEYEIRPNASGADCSSVYVREVSCGLLVLCLLFGQESCEGDNVRVDLLLAYCAGFAVLSHVVQSSRVWIESSVRGSVSWERKQRKEVRKEQWMICQKLEAVTSAVRSSSSGSQRQKVPRVEWRSFEKEVITRGDLSWPR